MIYKFTDTFDIEYERYYAILLKEKEEYIYCGFVLGKEISNYRERFAKYYLTTLRDQISLEDLIEGL